MPQAIITLPDVYETIIRKVAVDAIRQISTNMNIPNTAKVYLPGRSESVPMNDGLFGNYCDSANAVYFDPEERVTITYEEVADENFSLSTAVTNNDNYPLLVNDKNDISIHPITRFVDFRIDIEYQAPNVVIAQRWIDQQRMKYSAGAAEMTLSLTYHYNVPKPLMAMLKALYDTMQKSPKPSDLTFDCWLEQYWTGPTTDMATLVGTNPILSVYERAVDVVGWFDFYNTPETPRRADDGSGAYTTEYSFICRYARPTHLIVNYPLLMNNCIIPKKFFPVLPYANYQQMDRKTTRLRSSLEYQEQQKIKMLRPYIQHPDMDDWQPTFNEKNRMVVFTGLIVVCKDTPRTLMSLETLGRYKFSPFWLEAIKLLGDVLFAVDSFMEFSLFKNNRRVNYPLTINKDTMELMVDRDLDIESYYHVQLAFNIDLESINSKYWDEIRKLPHFFYDNCRLHGSCNFPFEDLDIIGIGRPRQEDGEGSTGYTYDPNDPSNPNYPDYNEIVKEGFVKKEEYYKMVEEVNNVNIRPGDIIRILNLGIITESR